MKKIHKEMLKNILETHSKYLIDHIIESIAIIETRLEISSSMGEESEVVYYTGALEQARLFLNLLVNSIDNVDTWCRIVEDEQQNTNTKKRIIRKPVTNEKSSIYQLLKGKGKNK